MSISNLIIFVSDYPYGPGEPFLEEELRVLSKEYEKIYLVNFTDSIIKNPLPYEFYVPQNAMVVSVKRGRKFLSLKSFFSLVPLFEIFIAITKHKKKINFTLFKLIYSYWIEGVRHEEQIKSFIHENGIDKNKSVFYSYWCDVVCVSLSNLARKDKSLNFVNRLHGWDLYFERHTFNFLPFRERIFNDASYVFPISNDGRKYILDKKLSISKDKIIAAHLGVSKLALNNFYIAEPVSEPVFRIVTISHINKVKSLDRLVDALSLIHDFDVLWTHIGYGDGVFDVAFKDYTRKMLDEKPNIQYEFTGKLYKEKVYNYIQNEPIHLIVNCSIAEGIPVSLMEAMSAGIPAISFNLGGIPEIVKNGYNGFLLDHIEPDLPGRLKNAIEKFYC